MDNGVQMADFLFTYSRCADSGRFLEANACLADDAAGYDAVRRGLGGGGSEEQPLGDIVAAWFRDIKMQYGGTFHENPGIVFVLYRSLRYMTFGGLKKIFPAPRGMVEQEVFDYSTAIFKDTCGEPQDGALVHALASIFDPDAMKKTAPESFAKDMELLQMLFFFLLWQLAGGKGGALDSRFRSAVREGTWYAPQTQADLLNCISGGLGFLKQEPFSALDFTRLTGNHFEANESVLRMLFNFTRGQPAAKEGIIGELNFVREQQRAILPVWPNTRKTNYSLSRAKREIKEKCENLRVLKALDFGFCDPLFSQCFFADNERLRKPFVRNVVCKCFLESEQEWEVAPFFDMKRRGRKIVARRSDRAAARSSLYHKFLYPERNMVTQSASTLPCIICSIPI